MQVYVANIAITASALRNPGGSGLVDAARSFLGNRLDLMHLRPQDPSKYHQWLDDQTNALLKRLSHHSHQTLWGAARKSINIFMTMAAMNRFLCLAYGLERFEDVMEVPLDSVVMDELRRWAKEQRPAGEGLPPPVSIKALTPETSDKYQAIAAGRAAESRVPRGRLDVALWKPVQEQSSSQPVEGAVDLRAKGQPKQTLLDSAK